MQRGRQRGHAGQGKNLNEGPGKTKVHAPITSAAASGRKINKAGGPQLPVFD
jgi:hypothetical protein